MLLRGQKDQLIHSTVMDGMFVSTHNSDVEALDPLWRYLELDLGRQWGLDEGMRMEFP